MKLPTVKLPKLVRVVRRFEIIPPFFGVAWVQYHSDAAVCLPVPFNLIAAFLRALWNFCRFGWRPVHLDPRSAYQQGRDDQRREIYGEDPVTHCELYQAKGCAHVDGFLCNTGTCQALKEYRRGAQA